MLWTGPNWTTLMSSSFRFSMWFRFLPFSSDVDRAELDHTDEQLLQVQHVVQILTVCLCCGQGRAAPSGSACGSDSYRFPLLWTGPNWTTLTSSSCRLVMALRFSTLERLSSHRCLMNQFIIPFRSSPSSTISLPHCQYRG